MDDIFILILPALVGLGIGYALGILSLGLQSDNGDQWEAYSHTG